DPAADRRRPRAQPDGRLQTPVAGPPRRRRTDQGAASRSGDGGAGHACAGRYAAPPQDREVNGQPTAGVVLDASALLALLREEEGAERVAEQLPRGAAISALNWAEVLARLIDLGGDPAE